MASKKTQVAEALWSRHKGSLQPPMPTRSVYMAGFDHGWSMALNDLRVEDSSAEEPWIRALREAAGVSENHPRALVRLSVVPSGVNVEVMGVCDLQKTRFEGVVPFEMVAMTSVNVILVEVERLVALADKRVSVQ